MNLIALFALGVCGLCVKGIGSQAWDETINKWKSVKIILQLLFYGG